MYIQSSPILGATKVWTLINTCKLYPPTLYFKPSILKTSSFLFMITENYSLNPVVFVSLVQF